MSGMPNLHNIGFTATMEKRIETVMVLVDAYGDERMAGRRDAKYKRAHLEAWLRNVLFQPVNREAQISELMRLVDYHRNISDKAGHLKVIAAREAIERRARRMIGDTSLGPIA